MQRFGHCVLRPLTGRYVYRSFKCQKGNVSLKDFIEEVKSELKSAVGEETLFF